jgi:hypothetical protein
MLSDPVEQVTVLPELKPLVVAAVVSKDQGPGPASCCDVAQESFEGVVKLVAVRSKKPTPPGPQASTCTR